MKKTVSIVLSFVLLIYMTSCGRTNKKAFQQSKDAYNQISIAYEITQQYGSDIYEAWRLGIFEHEELLDTNVEYLASKLSLSETEIRDGVGYVLVNLTEKTWTELSEEEKNTLAKNADIVFSMMEDDLFSFCVNLVVGAYTVNGKAEEVQTALNKAKAQMKELSETYSDYEYYPTLKEYYTTTSSFFDFCQNPTGTFEQVKETINRYNNKIRDCVNDLEYIFEE